MVATLAILALGATASTAVAISPHWVVAGKALAPGATEAIAESNTVTETFAIKTPKWGLECTSMKLSESFIEGENIRKDTVMNPESCKAVGFPSCKPGLKLSSLTSTLEGTAGHYKLNFKPSSGTTVAIVTLAGAGCGELGKLVVTGTWRATTRESKRNRKTTFSNSH